MDKLINAAKATDTELKEVEEVCQHEVNTDDIPYYKFREDAYLSWFRGYCFQVSGDSNGGGDYGSSDTTLRRDTDIAKRWPKDIRALMAFSHVCQSASKYGDFWGFVDKDPTLLNKFMVATNEEFYDCYCGEFQYEAIKDMVNNADWFDADKAVKIELSRSYYRKTGRVPSLIGTLYLDKSGVAFKDHNGKLRALSIPVFEHDTYYMSERTYYLAVLYRFIHIVLCLSGVAIDYMTLRYRDEKELELPDATEADITDGRKLFEKMEKLIGVIMGEEAEAK